MEAQIHLWAASKTRLLCLLTVGLVLAACRPSNHISPTPTVFTSTFPSATKPSTPLPTITPTEPLPPSPFPPTATLTPTQVPSPTPTITPTAPPPPGFSANLRSGVEAQSYIKDACQYLRLRWDPANSPPGTVVVPIMFHSIVKNDTEISNIMDISEQAFQDFVAYARLLGFKTISMAQLDNFLESNGKIPTLSMILIFDDRREGVVREHVMPVLEEFDWHASMAYITGPVVKDYEWVEMERLAATGRIDVQAHGYLHNGQSYIQDSTPEEVIRQEIFEPIRVIEAHFGYRPIAFIWPGGNYNTLGVQIAREADYRLGFTVDSSTPLLFNWIPLGEQARGMNDPLMVLPRAWSYEATAKLYQAMQIAGEAQAFAEQNYAQEAAWYQASCGEE